MGFEPTKALPTVLQTVPFSHSGTYPVSYLLTVIPDGYEPRRRGPSIDAPQRDAALYARSIRGSPKLPSNSIRKQYSQVLPSREIGAMISILKPSSANEANILAMGCCAFSRFNNSALVALWKEGKLVPVFPGDKR